MERWQLGRFRSPYLSIDSAQFDLATDSVEVRVQESSYTINQEGSICDLAALARTLNSLRDPHNSLWKTIRQQPNSDPSIYGILDQMDELSLVEESAVHDDQGIRDYLLECVERVFDGVRQAVPDSRKGALREAAAAAERVGETLIDGLGGVPGGNLMGKCLNAASWDDAGIGSFYLRVIVGQLGFHRLYAPQSPVFSCLLLRKLAEHTGSSQIRFPQADLVRIAAEFTPTASVRDTATHINSLGYLLSQGCQDTSCPEPSLPLSRATNCSGTTLAIHSERAAGTVLEQIGASPFLQAISCPPIPVPLVQGCFIEEYHVTCRFVEIIAATLARRLKPSLRTLLFKYYAEEIGHEQFERATCESIGVNQKQLDAAIPLPLHAAFVDLFTFVAATDPISYFASIFITEGMYGAPSPLNDYIEKGFGTNTKFTKTFRRHESLNDELSHSSLSRLLLAEIPYITPTQYGNALRAVITLVELNSRAWNALHDHYRSPTPIPYTGFLRGPTTFELS